MSPDEVRAHNLMSMAAHVLANAVRTGAYPSFESFLEAFSATLATRLELIDGQQEPTVHAWMSTLPKRIGLIALAA
jgi:hypothetical protein